MDGVNLREQIYLIDLIATIDEFINEHKENRAFSSEVNKFISKIKPLVICSQNDPTPGQFHMYLQYISAKELNSAFKICGLPYHTDSEDGSRIEYDLDFTSAERECIAKRQLVDLLKAVNAFDLIRPENNNIYLLKRAISVLIDAAAGAMFYNHDKKITTFHYNTQDINDILYHYGVSFRLYEYTGMLIVRKVRWG